MIRIAICDDTPMEADYLYELVEGFHSPLPHIPLRAERFASAEAVLEALEVGAPFDIYLLDIILPGMDGVALARELVRRAEASRIIFLTNSEDYAIEAFALRAADYLVKPVERSRLYDVLSRLITELGRKMEPTVYLQTPRMAIPVKLSEIVAVEVMGHTLRYLLTGGREYNSKALRISFEQATEELMADARFLRPHRSYIVNLAHVEKLGKYQFHMAGGAVVPISRLRFTEVKQAYLNYLAEMPLGPLP